MTILHLLHLKNYSIFEQLELEEALLRADTRNFCLINEGSTPAIVMGVSGQLNDWVNQEKAREHDLRVIKRFSGGGTVVVDENTLFISFIFQKECHNFPVYPEPIMRWIETILKPAIGHPNFALKQNDFVIGNRKCAGNAQYLKKERWLHHSTFLWDYQPKLMECLLHPKKMPAYRENRPHTEFICKLSEFLPSRNQLLNRLKQELSCHFDVKEISLEKLPAIEAATHRRTTAFVF